MEGERNEGRNLGRKDDERIKKEKMLRTKEESTKYRMRGMHRKTGKRT